MQASHAQTLLNYLTMPGLEGALILSQGSVFNNFRSDSMLNFTLGTMQLGILGSMTQSESREAPQEGQRMHLIQEVGSGNE